VLRDVDDVAQQTSPALGPARRARADDALPESRGDDVRGLRYEAHRPGERPEPGDVDHER
jgi:hypothetical protein